ncbi:MAG: peptidoglycan-binding domain-containing protein, partial [bacterium]
MSKKLFSIIAGIALMLSVSVVSVAQAATLTPGQINAIVVMLQSFGVDAQTVANVTASLNGTPVVTNPVVVATTFTKDLQVGSKGADVTALQNMLGVTPATGYFGPKTKAAVIKYQLEKGITPAFGYFGPKTRAIANGPITPVVVEVIPGTDLVVSLAATSPVGTAL